MDKQELREQVWDRLDDSGVARFPYPPHDRIPNFAGSGEAADRLAEGEGYSDLEFAILREFGVVDGETTTVTTVHEMQVVESEIPADSHDVPIDRIVTPDRTVERAGDADKPAGIQWDALSADRLDEIPILERIRSRT